MAIAKNPPSTAAFANRLITRLVIPTCPTDVALSSIRFTLSSRPSAFRGATSADPLLLAFQPHRPNRFWPSSRGASSATKDLSSIPPSCPGANHAPRTRHFLFSARRQNRLQRRNRPINLPRLQLRNIQPQNPPPQGIPRDILNRRPRRPRLDPRSRRKKYRLHLRHFRRIESMRPHH